MANMTRKSLPPHSNANNIDTRKPEHKQEFSLLKLIKHKYQDSERNRLKKARFRSLNIYVSFKFTVTLALGSNLRHVNADDVLMVTDIY